MRHNKVLLGDYQVNQYVEYITFDI